MQTLKTKPKISFSPLHRYTLDEFWELPEPKDGSHYDLIGGYLFMVPPPSPPHDDLDDRLTRQLAQFINENSIHGHIYHPHAAIYLDKEWGTYLYPDMMYVSHELKARMGKRRSSADIVFEYSSPSTSNYDRTTKADTYCALGVRELWVIDFATKTIEVRYGGPILKMDYQPGRGGSFQLAKLQSQEYCLVGKSQWKSYSQAWIDSSI